MMSVTTSMSAKRTPLYAQMDDVSTLRVVISANAIRGSHNPPTRSHVSVRSHRIRILCLKIPILLSGYGYNLVSNS